MRCLNLVSFPNNTCHKNSAQIHKNILNLTPLHTASYCDFLFNKINNTFTPPWCAVRLFFFSPENVLHWSKFKVCSHDKSAKLRANVSNVSCVHTCSRANVSCLLKCSRVNVSCVLTCQRTLRAYVLTCFACLHTHAPTCLACLSAHVV